MPARTRARLPWQTILLEAFFVAFGVALALAANEWRQARADARRAETALAGIREELRANRLNVLASVHYHITTSDSLHAFQQHAAPGAYPSPEIFRHGFVRPATLFETAWTTAVATDAISHMPYADVLALARVYELQQSYHRQTEQVGQLIYARLFAEGFEGMIRNYTNFNTILSGFWYRECQLLAGYHDVLSALGDAGGAPPDSIATPERCAYARTSARLTDAPAGRARAASTSSTAP